MKIADTSAQDVLVKKKTKPTRWVVSAIATVFLILLAFWATPAVQRWSGSTISVPMDRLRLAEVTIGDLVSDVSVQGRVVAAVSPTLFAPADGTITLKADAGSSVSKGEILAVIDSPELQNQLDQERSNLDRLSVELDRQRIEAKQKALDNKKEIDLARVTLIAAERERRRAESGHAIKAISQIDYEKTKDDLETAELAHKHAVEDSALDAERLDFELRTRELELDRQTLLVEDLERRVDALQLRSPVDGIVGNLLVDQKANVARNQEIMAVVDLSAFEVEAEVPESYADDLGLGMPAEILIANQNFDGAVVSVSPEVIGNQVTTRIRFSGEMPPGLRQNQRLTTRILLEEKQGVLTLPRGQFLDSGAGRVAYVLGEDAVARRRSIQVGARSLTAVEIASGLEAGETVVISSIDAFRGSDSARITD